MGDNLAVRLAAVSAALFWMALVLCAAAPARVPVDRPLDASVCDLVQHPSEYIGKRIQVRVQEGLSGPGIAVLHEPLRPDFKIDFIVYGKECVVGVDFEGTPPKDWALTEGLAFEGPLLRQFPINIYGPTATVIGRLRFSHEPARKPRIERDQNGKVVATHFYQYGPSNPEPELKLVIERVIEDR
jgi:hypothetical protein